MNETIGSRIQKYRKSRGLTQEELAAKLDVSAQAVSKWENDASCPDISLLPRLCQILGITVDELLTGKNDEVRLVPVEQRKSPDKMILRIKVNSSEGDVVRVNLPIPLVKLCMEIGMISLPNVSKETSDLLKSVDLEKLLAMVEQGLIGKLVEVESAEGDTVEIVVE